MYFQKYNVTVQILKVVQFGAISGFSEVLILYVIFCDLLFSTYIPHK